MSETLSCPDCGEEIESAADLEVEGAVTEIETDDGGIHLFENRDLFRCKGCRKPLGVGRSQ